MPLKLGKLPARPDAVKLKFAKYVDRAVLPKPPAEFGHERLVTQWGMLANDQVGNCVIAGGLHEHLLWNREAGHTIRVNDACAIKNYSIISGYNPKDPDTDQGTDMEMAARYRRQFGLIDADGKHRKIGAYVALEPGDIGQLWLAMWIFDGVGIGVDFPSQWMDAFDKRKVWDRVSRPKSEGGHYITGVAKRTGLASTVTWGRIQGLTAAGYAQFNDETYAYLSEEKLNSGKSLEGFDLATLRKDLTAVTSS